MYPKLIKSNIKLTIGILVSNSIGTIRNCMESIKPLLDAVPSELIVVDTKGEETDGSIAVVREYTDRIYPFVWCNDFAAARNVCIDHARGEWFLFLDDDEWFDDVRELIDFFKSGECEKYHSAFYYARNYAADGSYSDSIVGRMVRRTVHTRFVGKVHEGFNEVYAPNKHFSCFVHHYGYAFTDEEATKKHQQRNLSILKEELATEGYTPRVCAQMAQELLYLSETREEGLRFCMESIEWLEKSGKLMDACSQWLLLASVRAYFSQKEYKKAIAQAEEVFEHYELTQMARMAIAGVAVSAAVDGESYEVIPKYASVYLEGYDWLKKHPEEALLQTNLDMPKYNTERYRAQVLQAGAIVANIMQKFDQAFAYWKQLPWEAEWFPASKYKEDLLITLRGLEDKTPLIRYYRKFYKEEWFLEENREYLPKECREALKQ